jgi:hypothetical protein
MKVVNEATVVQVSREEAGTYTLHLQRGGVSVRGHSL